MSVKDHPNNAPGVPMVFPPWLERLQIKYVNPAVKPIARFLPGTATIKHRGRNSGTPYETVIAPYRKGNVLAIGSKTCWPPARQTSSSAATGWCASGRASRHKPARCAAACRVRGLCVATTAGAGPAAPGYMSRPMSSTRTEWVSAPTAR